MTKTANLDRSKTPAVTKVVTKTGAKAAEQAAPQPKGRPAIDNLADPQWYKDAVIYQLHVKSYMDGNGDGVGDFAGLISRLDYIASLGVTAIWLLPFYPSPRRDDGYDIADYTSVHPEYGTLSAVKKFI